MRHERRSGASNWWSVVGGILLLGGAGYWLSGPRPTEAQPTADAKTDAPVVRGYRVPQEHLQSAIDELREAFPAESGARFAVDTRMRQILAVAPVELQPRIERHLTRLLKQIVEESMSPRTEGSVAQREAKPAEDAPAAETGHAAASTTVPKVSRRTLRHLTAKELEASLRGLWGNRLGPAKTEGHQLVTLALPSSDLPAVLQMDVQKNVVQIAGSQVAHDAVNRLIELLDQPAGAARPILQLISPQQARDPQFRSSVSVLQSALDTTGDEQAPAKEKDAAADEPQKPDDTPPRPRAGEGPDAEGGDDESGLLGPVQIEIINEYGILVIRGKRRDVERVEQIIRDLQQKVKETKLTIQVYALKNANNEPLSTLVNQVYTQFLASRQGTVGIYPLVKPNALLLVGQADAIEVVIDLIQKLDRPVPPSAHWRVFPLEFLSATEALQTVNSFYNQRGGAGPGGGGGQQFPQQPQAQPGVPQIPGVQPQPVAPVAPAAGGGPGAAGLITGLGTRLDIVAEARTNALIVRGSPRDLADIAALLKKIDVEDSLAQSQVRIFKLTNALSRDLATVLQAAIRGQSLAGGAGGAAAGPGGAPGGFQQPQPQQPGGAGGAAQAVRTTSLNFVTVDKEGQRLVTSGIPGDVVVTADTTSNSLVVRASRKTMDLIAAIIDELDSLPDASAQIKVYTIQQSDATYLAQMLQQLFGQPVTVGRGTGGLFGGGAINQLAQAGLNTGDSALVPLRFAVDARTNSIIVSGSAGDLRVVEALLIRLDEEDVPTRRIAVYRLKNSFAQDVANSVTQFLTAQRQVVQQNLAFNVAIDPFEQLEREVAIAPEPVSNSVIISATPQFYDRIMDIIEQLDYRPPMVMVQVLIAEVRLTDVYQMGVELGLQDSLLFDRGKASLAPSAPQSLPGFGFGGSTLPNVNSVKQSSVAGQALSTLGLGRSDSILGYGGMVLSAASDSVNILVRALQDTGRLQILSRPQVMAIHNRQARILVGQKVPRITGTTFNTTGNAQNQVSDVDVGLILNIIPQINTDGIIVLNVQAERSRLGSEADGVTIAVNSNGDPIKSPPIDNTSAVTTISARDGQTVVFAGLITSEKANTTRGVPYLSNLPLLGHLFRYEADADRRTELLIIMTPRIIKYDEDYEWLSAMESERMSWCLADVVNIHGDVGMRGNNNLFCCDDVPIIYPDLDPTGQQYQRQQGSPKPGDKLHGAGKPQSTRPITGQPGARRDPTPGPNYLQPASEQSLVPNAGGAGPLPRVGPAGWNSPASAAPAGNAAPAENAGPVGNFGPAGNATSATVPGAYPALAPAAPVIPSSAVERPPNLLTPSPSATPRGTAPQPPVGVAPEFSVPSDEPKNKRSSSTSVNRSLFGYLQPGSGSR